MIADKIAGSGLYFNCLKLVHQMAKESGIKNIFWRNWKKTKQMKVKINKNKNKKKKEKKIKEIAKVILNKIDIWASLCDKLP